MFWSWIISSSTHILSTISTESADLILTRTVYSIHQISWTMRVYFYTRAPVCYTRSYWLFREKKTRFFHFLFFLLSTHLFHLPVYVLYWSNHMMHNKPYRCFCHDVTLKLKTVRRFMVPMVPKISTITEIRLISVNTVIQKEKWKKVKEIPINWITAFQDLLYYVVFNWLSCFNYFSLLIRHKVVQL